MVICGKIRTRDGDLMFNKDIGIDLGTANVLIYIKGQGIVLNEPSVVAIDSETKRPLAVGSEAHEMLGRTPGKVKAIKPMKDGVIADFETTEVMLNYFIKKVNGKNFFSRPRILICCPSNITQVEKNAIKEAAERTGAKKVFLEEEPKVAAIGAGMDISKPSANMVIDIGGGTTDIAILSLLNSIQKRNLIYSDDVRDFIVSGKLIGMLMAQASISSNILYIFYGLLSKNGKDIIMSPYSDYFNESKSFKDVYLYLLRKKVIIIGVKRYNDVIINPNNDCMLDNKDEIIIITNYVLEEENEELIF